MPYKDPKVKKEKQAGYSRTYYSKNKDKSKVATKNNKIKERLKWYIFKATLKCTACGYSHIAAMDFHHEDPSTKKGSVHQFISNGQFAKAYEEIKKCIVLCANCHRIHHHNERLKRKKIPKGINVATKKIPIGTKNTKPPQKNIAVSI